MDFNKLFDLSYLFERYPETGFSWPLRIVLLAIFVSALLLAIYSHKKIKKTPGIVKNLWQKLEIWGWTTGLVGLLLFSFREIKALYLSSRAWMLLFLLIIFIWLIFIFIYWKKKIPAKEERAKRQEEFNKWLPKKK